jgi:hypothetical protein
VSIEVTDQEGQQQQQGQPSRESQQEGGDVQIDTEWLRKGGNPPDVKKSS